MKWAIDMILSAEELDTLEKKIIDKIISNVRVNNRTGDLENYLHRIECDDLITPYNTEFSSNAKIIVIGSSKLNQTEMKSIAKKMGIHPSHLELHLDYEKNKHFNFDLLRNNINYSDIIFGPISHKCVEIKDNSSAISLIRNNPGEYPKMIIATDSHGLKITKQSFKRSLENTQYFKRNIICME